MHIYLVGASEEAEHTMAVLDDLHAVAEHGPDTDHVIARQRPHRVADRDHRNDAVQRLAVAIERVESPKRLRVPAHDGALGANPHHAEMIEQRRHQTLHADFLATRKRRLRLPDAYRQIRATLTDSIDRRQTLTESENFSFTLFRTRMSTYYSRPSPCR